MDFSGIGTRSRLTRYFERHYQAIIEATDGHPISWMGEGGMLEVLCKAGLVEPPESREDTSRAIERIKKAWARVSKRKKERAATGPGAEADRASTSGKGNQAA
ncbi:MAG: hypothetical protein JO110_03765 [Acetobacteraceae bacterium]|nr:hypothetical protein [Acetobacteraceae bacterium]